VAALFPAKLAAPLAHRQRPAKVWSSPQRARPSWAASWAASYSCSAASGFGTGGA